LLVTLESNLRTGHRWRIAGALPAQFEQLGDPEYSQDGDAPGAGGTTEWRFRARSVGRAVLKLDYAAADGPVAESFGVTIEVE
jgi:predicted secreted protein